MANKGKPFSDDVPYPRITFQAPGRNFDRLLKESSLSDLKETVRKKLDLGLGSVVQFIQLRNGQLVDLEDEDDFDAFCIVVNEQRHANVQVVLTEKSIAEDSSVDAKRGNPPISDAPSNSMSSTSPLPLTPARDPRQLNGTSPRLQPGTNASPSQVSPAMTSPRRPSATPPPPPSMAAQTLSHAAPVLEDLSAVAYPEASGPSMPFHNSLLLRTENQGVEPVSSHRMCSERGEKRSEARKTATAGVWPQAHGPAYDQPHASQAPNFEPVAPLQMSENRWDRKSFHNNNPGSPEVVDRKVKALLNKLTMEKFDSISDQIIQWANRSKIEKDGRTLIQVIRIVFEKATDEATWSEMYARLCRKMMEQISPKVQDEGIRNNEGNPITGGQLFRKYLLNRCQEDFERGWFAKEATAAAVATKAVEDQAVKAANDGDVALRYSDEYYVAQKARRQGLGLIKFIGELFKFQMLTERIMHECIKKLLGNVQNPEEDDIESLCMLLTTVGSLLDNQKARAHLDIYFQRMQELSKNVNPRMQYMLQDLIELRDRKWQAWNAVAAPTTIAQVHEAATKQRLSASCGCSRRGSRDKYPKADRVSRATAQASGLSQFGRFSKAQPPTTLGPRSMFAGKKDLERETISSSSNMFSALLEAQQESNKASEQPTNLVEQPSAPVFFSIWNLLLIFLQSIYIMPDPGTSM